MEMVGANLAYRLVLSGTFVSVYAHCMDNCEEPQFLLTVNDDRAGWRLAVKLLRQLEESTLRNLSKRPIELGDIPGFGETVIE